MVCKTSCNELLISIGTETCKVGKTEANLFGATNDASIRHRSLSTSQEGSECKYCEWEGFHDGRRRGCGLGRGKIGDVTEVFRRGKSPWGCKLNSVKTHYSYSYSLGYGAHSVRLTLKFSLCVEDRPTLRGERHLFSIVWSLRQL